MALVDIDRHILSEIVQLSARKKERQVEFQKQFSILCDCGERGDALYWTKNGGSREKELKRIRRKFFKAQTAITEIATRLLVLDTKQEALFQHLVSKVIHSETVRDTERKT